MAVVVRPAEVADAAPVATVNTESWRETYAGLMPAEFLARHEFSPDVWVQRIESARQSGARHAVWVAELDGRVVGFASSGPDLDQPELGCVYTIYLLRRHHGRGVGHRLYREAVDWLTAAGFTEALLWVLDTNEPAIAFYRRQGWELDGAARTEDLGTPVREVRMRTVLAQPPTAR